VNDQVKGEMMNGNSLGEAIQKLKPNVNARQEAIKGNQQALDEHGEIDSSEQSYWG
jgi:hypothetical protein